MLVIILFVVNDIRTIARIKDFAGAQNLNLFEQQNLRDQLNPSIYIKRVEFAF